MARAAFRRTGSGIALNVYLPNQIFERDADGQKRLATFTYDARRNILSAGRDFAFFVHGSVTDSLKLLTDPGVPTFTWTRR